MSHDPYQIPQTPPPMNTPGRPERLGDNAGIRMLLPVGRSGWAIAAGYLGLLSFVVLPGPLALIASLLAIRDIKRSELTGAPKHGMGRAVFGLVMGIIATGIIILGVINIYFLHH